MTRPQIEHFKALTMSSFVVQLSIIEVWSEFISLTKIPSLLLKLRLAYFLKFRFFQWITVATCFFPVHFRIGTSQQHLLSIATTLTRIGNQNTLLLSYKSLEGNHIFKRLCPSTLDFLLYGLTWLQLVFRLPSSYHFLASSQLGSSSFSPKCDPSPLPLFL